MLANYYSNERLASIYYAYHVIHRYLEEPFTTHMAEGLFSIARFLINEILDDKPREISLLYPNMNHTISATVVASSIFTENT